MSIYELKQYCLSPYMHSINWMALNQNALFAKLPKLEFCHSPVPKVGRKEIIRPLQKKFGITNTYR